MGTALTAGFAGLACSSEEQPDSSDATATSTAPTRADWQSDENNMSAMVHRAFDTAALELVAKRP
jgi:hypothetical protein